MKDKEWIIKQTDASMRLEGMPLTESVLVWENRKKWNMSLVNW